MVVIQTVPYTGELRTMSRSLWRTTRGCFGNYPNMTASPLQPDSSPELDTSDLLDEEGIKKYQSLIGALHWCVTLGRMDIAVAVIGLSSFRAAPREGHLEHAKHVFDYLRKHPNAAIRFRTLMPDVSGLELPEFDWMYSVYGKEVKEETVDFLPKPKGKAVRTISFVDANLYHCRVAGKAATEVLHLVNQTPVD